LASGGVACASADARHTHANQFASGGVACTRRADARHTHANQLASSGVARTRRADARTLNSWREAALRPRRRAPRAAIAPVALMSARAGAPPVSA